MRAYDSFQAFVFSILLFLLKLTLSNSIQLLVAVKLLVVVELLGKSSFWEIKAPYLFLSPFSATKPREIRHQTWRGAYNFLMIL